MKIETRRMEVLRYSSLAFGLAAVLAVFVTLGLVATVSAQDPGEPPVVPPAGPGVSPTPTATPDKPDGHDGSGAGADDGSSVPRAPCRVTSMGTVASSVSRTGSWSSGCLSVNRTGRYAQFFSFTLAGAADVTIDLDSTDLPEVDAYMFLLNGSGTAGSVVDYDDDGGLDYNSQLVLQLAAGTYTVEATTFSRRATGAFRVTVAATPVVAADCAAVDLGTVARGSREGRVGEWAAGCASQNRSGKYARYYSFRVTETSDIRIDLGSVDYPADDTYLYLISGASKTGTVLELDNNGGEGLDSRITRSVPAGTYLIEATTRLSGQTGRFTVSVEVSRPEAAASGDKVYLGQSVTLSATVPSTVGTVSTYRWQRWNGSSWSDVGTASSSSSRTVQYSVAGKRIFRVAVNYSGGSVTTYSTPVSVEWVSLAPVTYSPEMPGLGRSVVLRVRGVSGLSAPSGTSYQWQQTNSSGAWVNLGSSTSSSTKSVTQSAAGTRKYRVVVSYTVGTTSVTETSDAVYVTWDEQGLVRELLTALDAAVFGSASQSGTRSATGNAVFSASERSFLVCVNRGRAAAERFTTFQDVLAEYSGTLATRVNSCASGSSSSSNVFVAYGNAVDAELRRLSASNQLYLDYLATDRGSQFSRAVGSESLLKLFGSLEALGVDAPTDEDETSSGSSRGDCIPASEPANLAGKLDALNCLVFQTDYAFYTLADVHSRTPIRNAAWMGDGNWECDASADGPLPSCRRHDVAYASLQKFAGRDSTSELDRTWNPRNKALADAKFRADIQEWRCLGGNLAGRTTFCLLPTNWLVAEAYFTGVAKINSKGWPVTEQDLDHARAHRSSGSSSATAAVSSHAFVDCATPVPTISGLSVTWDDDDGDYRASWTHVPGCVSDIVINRMWLLWYVFYDNGEVGRHVDLVSNGTATSSEFDVDEYSDLNPYAVAVIAYLFPGDVEYGGSFYQSMTWDYLGP